MRARSGVSNEKWGQAAALLGKWREESDDGAGGSADAQRLRPFAETNVVAARTRASAYESAFDGHAQAKAKLQKGEKKRQQQLQQDERAARSKATEASRVAQARMKQV